jgi:5-methylcytosine-specific restriction enzyme B
MAHSDDVRDYVFKTYIQPARDRGDKSVAVRVGDVHSALHFRDRLPLICTALGAMKFRNQYGLTLLRTEGPAQSTTTTYTFGL